MRESELAGILLLVGRIMSSEDSYSSKFESIYKLEERRFELVRIEGEGRYFKFKRRNFIGVILIFS